MHELMGHELLRHHREHAERVSRHTWQLRNGMRRRHHDDETTTR
jgi:hypothetical protein